MREWLARTEARARKADRIMARWEDGRVTDPDALEDLTDDTELIRSEQAVSHEPPAAAEANRLMAEAFAEGENALLIAEHDEASAAELARDYRDLRRRADEELAIVARLCLVITARGGPDQTGQAKLPIRGHFADRTGHRVTGALTRQG